MYRVDWNKGGFWRVLDADLCDCGHFARVDVEVPSRLELESAGHGWLVVDDAELVLQDGNAARLIPRKP